MKLNNRTMMIHILRGNHKDIIEEDMLVARDEKWRLLRKAWQPAFSSSALTGYLALMDQSAKRMAELLCIRSAGYGEGSGAETGQRLNIHWELGRMTLRVVGTCAYGVDFHTMDDAALDEAPVDADPSRPPSPTSPGLALAKACKAIFMTSSVSRGSNWTRLHLVAPLLRPITSRLAYAFPDEAFKQQIEARDVMYKTTRELIKSHAKQASPASFCCGSATPAASGASAPAPPAAPDSPKLPVDGVLPGSFMGLMLAARNKATGEHLTDVQIMAQAQTFILAGYETTANALAFTIYFISRHPEVQDKLLAEIDALMDSLGGPDADLTQEALEKCEYTSAVFNESMRLIPPAHVIPRRGGSITLGKHAIPAESTVWLSVYATHHDPALWPEPEEFKPERFLAGASEVKPNSHIPFGMGARMCIGYKFALMEAKVALIRLFSHLTFDLEPGQVPLPIAYGITSSPKNGIWVRPRLRTRRT